MATFKWTPSRTAKLLTVPFDSPDYKTKLQKLAEKWNITYRLVYNKWYYEYNKAGTSKVPKNTTVEIPAMVIAVDLDATPGKVDSFEVISMKKGLDAVIPKLGVNKGAAIIEKRFVHVAGKYLKQEYNKMAFIFSQVPGNPKMSRIFRKV